MKEELIRKLFNNTSSMEELLTLLQLIEKDPTPPSSALMKKLYESMDEHSERESRIKDRVYASILDRVDATELTVSQPSIRHQADGATRRQTFAIAASMLVLVGLAFSIYRGATNEQVVATQFGQQHAIELSDGSQVKLNANSQLIFNKSWSSDEDREVWLEGEAFFEVEKKPLHRQKFQVMTRDLTIEVLGTSFNVNSYGGKTSVYLEEGSILLALVHLDTTLLMKAGDLIVYSATTNTYDRTDSIASKYHTSWKEGVLIFKQKSLRVVLEKMEEIFGVQFSVANEAHYHREINYSLPINELKTAMTILEKTVDGVTFRQEGNTIYLE